MTKSMLRATRREFLVGAAGLGATAMFGGRPAFSADVDWKKFSGQTLDVNLVKSPRSDTLLKYMSEFEEMTGMKVNAEATPEQQQRQKTVIELSSGKPSFDVIHLSYHVQKRQFEKAGWLADIGGYVCVLSHAGPDALSVTTNLNINFMRKAEAGPIDGHCRILKLGRSLMVFDIEMVAGPDRQVVAHATGTYSIPPKRAV